MIFLKFYAISEQLTWIFRETSPNVSHFTRFSRNLAKCKPLYEIFAKPSQILAKSPPYQHNLRDFRETSPIPHYIREICSIFAKPRKPFMKSYTSSKSILKFKSLKLSQNLMKQIIKKFFTKSPCHLLDIRYILILLLEINAS